MRGPRAQRPGLTSPQPADAPGASGVGDATGFLFHPDPAPAPPLGHAASTAQAKPTKRTQASPEKPHYHDHRARLRAKFAEAGPAALADYELLELYLFRVIPRQDTKPLAKALLARFGSVAAVLGAEPDQIAAVPGAGPAVAGELRLAHALAERAAQREAVGRPVISSWSQLLAYCRIGMAHEGREQFRVLFLDVRNQLLADRVLGTGTIDQAPVYPREVAKQALSHNAAAVILVHNHPSGDTRPSAADIAITKAVVAALAPLSIQVHDHLIIGARGETSFKALGLL